jgi:hypothetical protein
MPSIRIGYAWTLWRKGLSPCLESNPCLPAHIPVTGLSEAPLSYQRRCFVMPCYCLCPKLKLALQLEVEFEVVFGNKCHSLGISFCRAVCKGDKSGRSPPVEPTLFANKDVGRCICIQERPDYNGLPLRKKWLERSFCTCIRPWVQHNVRATK